MKRLRLRYTAALIIGICGSLFLVVVWAMEFYTKQDVEMDIAEYAQLLAIPLSQADEARCRDYLTLITRIEAYEHFAVLREDGEEIVSVNRATDPLPLESTLRKIGLVRSVPRTAPIVHQGRIVGQLESRWINRNIYFHLAITPLFATIALGLLVSRYLRHSREREHAQTLTLEKEKVIALQSQRALQRTEERYKSLIENATDIIYECDLNGRFTYINPTAKKTLGFDQAELLGKHFGKLVPSEYRGELLRHYRDQMARGRENSYREFPIVTGKAERIWIGQNVQLVYTDDKVSGFQAVARDISDLKEAMQLLAERDEYIGQELQLARQIHQALIPLSVPRLHGFEFGLRFIPSGVIGGDFINFVEFPDNNRLGVIFADITGHGVAAALLSAMLKVLVDEVIHSGSSPASGFNILNKRISEEFPEGNYVSAFYAIFDRRQNTMTYVKASQEPVYHIKADQEIVCLDDGGPALGLLDPFCFGDPVYEQFTIQLAPGDTVFFYTDGLIELWDTNEEFLERDSVTAWLREEYGKNPQDLVDSMYDRAVKFSGTSELKDDVAELAVRVTSL